MTSGWATALIAFLVCLGLAPMVAALLRRWSVLDNPSERSSHAVPTPRGGGVAPVAGMLVALAATQVITGDFRVALAVATVSFALVGLLEDVKGVPVLPRLSIQVVLALVALPFLIQGLTGPTAWKVVFAAGCAVWLVGYVNAFNFMDGINGISSAQAIVSGGFWALLGVIEGEPLLSAAGAVLAAVGLGFAPVNFPRAKVFLGDVGSYGIGAWSAVTLVIALRLGVPPVAVIAPVALYLVDTSTTLARRILRGERWYDPHRNHTYQRLLVCGWTHTRTTLVVAGLVTLCSSAGLLALLGPAQAVVGAALVGLLLLGYLRLPRLLSMREQGAAAWRLQPRSGWTQAVRRAQEW